MTAPHLIVTQPRDGVRLWVFVQEWGYGRMSTCQAPGCGRIVTRGRCNHCGLPAPYATCSLVPPVLPQ